MLSIAEVTTELRVPELKYKVSNRDETDDLVFKVCDYLVVHQPVNSKGSLLEAAERLDIGLTPRIYNALFFYDRLFDVFLRKANFDEQIKERVSQWRYAVAMISIKFPNLVEDANSPVVSLIDNIVEGLIEWTPEPKRIAPVLLDKLSKVNESLLILNSESENAIASIDEKWNVEQSKQQKRLDQLFIRLLATEQGAATSRYAIAYSKHVVNMLTANKELPKVVNEFITKRWVEVLRQCLLGQSGSVKWSGLEDQTKNLITLFSALPPQRLQALYGIATELIDNLAKSAESLNVSVETVQWEELQRLLIGILQGESVERVSTPLFDADDIDFSEENQPSEQELSESVGKWFFVDIDGSSVRLKFSHYFDDSREVLWLNHAGMKSGVMPFKDFKRKKNEGKIKPIVQCVSFCQILSDTLKGLGKVAQVQIDARKKARIKAEGEADKLRLEKIAALEKARRQEAEAVERLKEQKLEEEEKIRLEKEHKVLKKISALTLGAWVSIDIGGVPEKYKLVVKINASDKFIFVDKLGLKKVEIKTPDLVSRLISESMKILSAGVEFDDTLSRVVGRMRMSKGG